MAEKQISDDAQRAIMRKMVGARSAILDRYPFYGYLVMHLDLGVTDCGTACTDMKHLLFDPEFAERLDDDQMIFVMMHEVLHCALEHCTRGRGYLNLVYNIAADIVVNSNILLSMGLEDFTVDGMPAMHKVPDGREGHLFSVEEVYRMLLKAGMGRPDDGGHLVGSGPADSSDPAGSSGHSGTIDSHDIWVTVEETDARGDRWKNMAREAGKGYSPAEIPPIIRDRIRELEREARVNWRAVLQDFIQIVHDRFDYSFSPADRRYSGSDFVMPAFSELEDEKVENLWFCVDTSGSISDKVLSEVLAEIRQAILLFARISGRISFFDTHVTEPVPFEDEGDIRRLKPVGGGGTSFPAIFRAMGEYFGEELPSAVIVLTDGRCRYPKEKEARDVPVLWIIYDNPVDAPWGRCVRIESD